MTRDVGNPDHDFAVEPPRPPERGVERVWKVRRADDDDLTARFEPVHQRQQLRDDALLHLADRVFPPRRDRVDLVEKDNAWRGLLRLLEHLAKPGLALPVQPVHDFGSADGEKGRLGFAGHGARQQRFAAAGRTVEQDALATHGCDRGLRAGVGGISHVGRDAEGGLGRFRYAAADGDHRVVLRGQLSDDAVGRVAVGREDAKAVVALRRKARKKLVLKVLFPVARDLKGAFGEAEISLRVHDRLPHRLEIGMRTSGDDGHCGVGLGCAAGGGPSTRSDDQHRRDGQ